MKPPITTKICGSSSIGRAFNVIRSIDNQTLLIDSSNLIALVNICIYIGVSPSGKALDFDSSIIGSNPVIPAN